MTLKHFITILLGVFAFGGLTRFANAEDSAPQCSTLYRSPSGQHADAAYSANRYSEEHVGAVGISIFPSIDQSDFDPHATGLSLVRRLQQNNIEAACFVNHSPTRNSASIAYRIDGLSWREGNANLSIVEAQDENTIRSVAAEAKMVQAIFSKKRP